MDTNDRIGTNLGHDRKQSRDRRGRIRIGRGQPEMQRHQGRLDPEDDQKQHRCHPDQAIVTGFAFLHLDNQVSDVQRSGRSVKRAQGEQEQRRADKVHHHILQPRLQPDLAARMDHQTVGRDQQDLEEYEQVKGVAGQERAADAHQLELKQRVKMVAAFVPPGRNGMKKHDHRKKRRQQYHQR